LRLLLDECNLSGIQNSPGFSASWPAAEAAAAAGASALFSWVQAGAASNIPTTAIASKEVDLLNPCNLVRIITRFNFLKTLWL